MSKKSAARVSRAHVRPEGPLNRLGGWLLANQAGKPSRILDMGLLENFSFLLVAGAVLD
jgi:hypothetical protein